VRSLLSPPQQKKLMRLRQKTRQNHAGTTTNAKKRRKEVGSAWMMEEYIDIIGSSDNELPGPSIDSSTEQQLAATLSEDTPLAELGSSSGTRVENANTRHEKRQRGARRTSKRVRKAQQTDEHGNSDSEQVDLSRMGHRLYCTICGQAGELEPCDTCPRAFHKTCLERLQVKAAYGG